MRDVCGREVCGQVCAVQKGFGADTGGCGFLVLCSVDRVTVRVRVRVGVRVSRHQSRAAAASWSCIR